MPDYRAEMAPDAVQRLAAARNGEAFLQADHIEAARMLARLFDRAQLRQRVTMSYDPTRTGGRGGAPVQAELADSAADARRQLNRLARLVSRDCWDVLTDVCAFDKGLQQIETEREWPRRGAKLVLRIGLDQIGAIFGLSPQAKGGGRASMVGWLEERPPMFRDA